MKTIITIWGSEYMNKKLLVIGAGIAGLNAAKSAREGDSDCNITILELENLNIYTRTRIPHYISGEVSLKELMPYGDDWYIKNNINLIKGINVTGIDVNVKKILADKENYNYDARKKDGLNNDNYNSFIFP